MLPPGHMPKGIEINMIIMYIQIHLTILLLMLFLSTIFILIITDMIAAIAIYFCMPKAKTLEKIS
jgi:hypothetical protein